MNSELGALQLCHEYGVIIDSDAFLGAFTMDTGSQRVKGGLWSLGLWVTGNLPTNPPLYQWTTSWSTRIISRYPCLRSGKGTVTYFRHAAACRTHSVCCMHGQQAPPLGMEDENE